MKKVFLVLAALLAAMSASAQKIGFVDMQTILGSIPEYNEAQTTIKSMGEKYQKEVESAYKVVEDMYNRYQREKNSLSANMRQSRENEIILKEREVKSLQDRYFGKDGVMAEESRKLLDPINTRVKSEIDAFAEREGYTMILDASVLAGVVYTDKASDISERIIALLEMK